jgi:hypothetical protein
MSDEQVDGNGPIAVSISSQVGAPKGTQLRLEHRVHVTRSAHSFTSAKDAGSAHVGQ